MARLSFGRSAAPAEPRQDTDRDIARDGPHNSQGLAGRLNDAPWIVGVSVVSFVIFASSVSPRMQLGDSPESVAGVKAIGILHAPGYFVYVLATRLVTILEPFGSLT